MFKVFVGLIMNIFMALIGTSCSSLGTAVTEYDSLLLPPRTGKPEEPLRYGQTSARLPWMLRQMEGSGLDWFWARVLGTQPSPLEVENPLYFAFIRLKRMGKADSPKEIILCSYRLFLAAMKDPWELNRSISLEGLKSFGRIIGPGRPDFHVSKDSPPKPFVLDENSRKQIQEQAKKGVYHAWREKLKKVFLYAMMDRSPHVVGEAIQGLYDLWGPEGLLAAIQLIHLWSPLGSDPYVLRKAAFLCSGVYPEFARKERNGISIFGFLYTCLTKVPDPGLGMVSMRSISLILGKKPRYETDWYKTWWKKEETRRGK